MKGLVNATRYSSTVKRNMLYVAVFNKGYIVRLALPYNGIFDNLPTLVMTARGRRDNVVSHCFILIERFANTLTAPIQDITTQVTKMKDYR